MHPKRQSLVVVDWVTWLRRAKDFDRCWQRSSDRWQGQYVREGNECEQAKDIAGGGRSRLAYIPKIGRYTQPDLIFSSNNTFKYLQISASLYASCQYQSSQDWSTYSRLVDTYNLIFSSNIFVGFIFVINQSQINQLNTGILSTHPRLVIFFVQHLCRF